MKYSLLKDMLFVNALNIEHREIKEAVFTNIITEEPLRIPVERYVEARDKILANKALHFSVITRSLAGLLYLLFKCVLAVPIVLAFSLLLAVLLPDSLFGSMISSDSLFTMGLEQWVEFIKPIAAIYWKLSFLVWLFMVALMLVINTPIPPAVYENLLKYRLISDLPQVNNPDLYFCGKPEKFKLAFAQLSRL